LHEQMGLTSIFVTHDQEEALELADRVVVLDRGVIEQVGTPEEVYMAPRSGFVSGFVGDSNSLPVTVRSGRAQFEGQPLDVPVERLPAFKLHMDAARIKLSIGYLPSIRMVTHLDIDDAGVDRAIGALRSFAA